MNQEKKTDNDLPPFFAEDKVLYRMINALDGV